MARTERQAEPSSQVPKTVQAHPALWRRAIGPAVLFVLVVALYAPSMRSGFVYDDSVLITNEPTPRSVGDIVRVFAERHWPDLPYYRPVARLTMVVQKFLHGDNPGPYHLFNAVLMGMAAVLACVLLRLPIFAVRPPLALLGAALFAVHPIASSCVYPICSGRETLMPALFTIAGLYAFLRGGGRWYVLAILMFTMSLLCKEQAVVVLGLFVLADVIGFSADAPGRSVSRWVWRYIPMLVILLVYFLIRWLLFGGGMEHRLAVLGSPSGPLMSLLYALQMMFVPFVELVYEPPSEIWMSTWRQLVWLVIVVLLAVAAYRHWSAVCVVVFFWLGWIFLALVPTANLLVQEARFAERYGFLAFAGVIGIVGRLASAAWDRPASRRWITGVGLSFLVACAVISFHRGTYFQNNSAFFNQWLRTNPQSAPAHSGVAKLFCEEGKLDEAISHYRQAVQADPDYVYARSNLGLVLQAQGKLDEAMHHYRQALQVRPDYAEAHCNIGNALQLQGKVDEAIHHFRQALQAKPDYANAYNNLGSILAEQGKFDEAISHFRQAVRFKPDFAEAHYNLGNTLHSQGKLDEAIDCYRQALQIKPDYASVHNNLGSVLSAQGRFDEAISHYRQALHIKPDFAEVHNNLGIVFESQGKLDEAISHYRQALQVKPDWPSPLNAMAWILAMHPEPALRDVSGAIALAEQAAELTKYQDAFTLETLATAYASAGQFDRAVMTAQRALELASAGGDDELANRIRKQLQLYRQDRRVKP